MPPARTVTGLLGTLLQGLKLKFLKFAPVVGKQKTEEFQVIWNRIYRPDSRDPLHGIALDNETRDLGRSRSIIRGHAMEVKDSCELT